jgi:hypothetical protein
MSHTSSGFGPHLRTSIFSISNEGRSLFALLSSRMDTEVLDLIADDSAGVQKQKATYHWDKVG